MTTIRNVIISKRVSILNVACKVCILKAWFVGCGGPNEKGGSLFLNSSQSDAQIQQTSFEDSLAYTRGSVFLICRKAHLSSVCFWNSSAATDSSIGAYTNSHYESYTSDVLSHGGPGHKIECNTNPIFKRSNITDTKDGGLIFSQTTSNSKSSIFEVVMSRVQSKYFFLRLSHEYPVSGVVILFNYVNMIDIDVAVMFVSERDVSANFNNCVFTTLNSTIKMQNGNKITVTWTHCVTNAPDFETDGLDATDVPQTLDLRYMNENYCFGKKTAIYALKNKKRFFAIVLSMMNK